MCVDNPVPFHSDTPVIAYKVMLYDRETNTIQSMVAGNRYLMGTSNVASEPSSFFSASCSNEYETGFHAYEEKEDAEKLYHSLMSHYYSPDPPDFHEVRIIEVELTEITHKGNELRVRPSVHVSSPSVYVSSSSVYVAQKCRFIRVVEES